VQALDRDAAVVVVQRRDQTGEGHQGVGHETAPHAGVHGVGQGADLDVDTHQAAQAGGQGRHADVPVAAVGDHDDVGAEVVVVLFQQGREAVGADLLLALDEHHHVDRQVVAVRADRAQVGDDAGLVVGRPARVETAAVGGVALGRLERRGVPVCVVVLGLYVVVGVEQHRRCALAIRLPVRDHGRKASIHAGDLAFEALSGEQGADGLGTPLHLAGTLGVGTDRLDPDQGLEVASYTRQDVAHPRPEVVGRVVCTHGRQPIHPDSP
jgi:hypothetical protein